MKCKLNKVKILSSRGSYSETKNSELLKYNMVRR